MSKVFADISTSLDGYVAGPSPSLEEPLGIGGETLHEWVFGLEAWRGPHGLEGGETNASSAVVEERITRPGAVVMGRRMFSNGEGPWDDDPKADGWWGDDPPFHVPVFVRHPPRARAAPEGGRHDLHLRHRRRRVRDRAGSGGGRGEGRTDRRRRERDPAGARRRVAGRDPDQSRTDASRRRHAAVRPGRRPERVRARSCRGRARRHAPPLPRRAVAHTPPTKGTRWT